MSEKNMIIVNIENEFKKYAEGKKKNPDNKIVILRKREIIYSNNKGKVKKIVRGIRREAGKK